MFAADDKTERGRDKALAREIVQVIHPTFSVNMTAEQLDADAVCQWLVGVIDAIRQGKR
jgi:hypothetical protein